MIRVKGDPIEWGEAPLKKRVWPKHVTETLVTEKTVTENITVTRGRGRPRKEGALTPAEKQRAYRERKRARG